MYVYKLHLVWYKYNYCIIIIYSDSTDVIRPQCGSGVTIEIMDLRCCQPTFHIVFANNTSVYWGPQHNDSKILPYGYTNVDCEPCFEGVPFDDQCNIHHDSPMEISQSLYTITCNTITGNNLYKSILLGEFQHDPS